MRKALKGLRYMSEFFGSLYEAPRVERFVRKMKRLQDVFGYLNDVSTAKALDQICDAHCADSREARRAAGYVLGWHDVMAECAWKRAAKAWRRLEKSPQFWD
jgi:CHAD domain-containing protein